MPKIKTYKKKAPKGWDLLEPTLLDLEQKMSDGMLSPISHDSPPFIVYQYTHAFVSQLTPGSHV
jgi:hypothetical protein